MPLTHLPPDLAVLLVTMTARQAASPTALVATRTGQDAGAATRFAPNDGAFNGAVADLLMRWKVE